MATITLRGLDATGARLQPLDGRGQAWGAPRPFATVDDGGDQIARIALTGEPATPWYLIEVQR